MISLILYGRNDSYGYNLHKRAAISLNCMAEVLTAPDDEIIFVDYNTPDDFPTFPEAIQDTLTERAKKLLRILRVRPSQHARFKDRTRLVALEPISRNVALRRSNPANRWVLSTNTDMVFVMQRGSSLSEIAAELPDAYYPLPRFEVPETLWESANRLDPKATIEAFGAWGRSVHLNEIVFSSDPTVKYDAPGDFQLALRCDLFRMHGFHEGMLLGWHVDSNLAKRLALLPRNAGDLLDDVLGYHCDHTRQVTPAHRPNAVANDLQEFFADVTSSEIPEQAEIWGLAGEIVEEIAVDTTSRLYLEALRLTIASPLTGATPRLSYTYENHNRVDYSVEHLLPFLADAVASYPRDTILGWFGSKRTLLDSFALAWKAMGFTKEIQVWAGAHWLGPDLPNACVRVAEDVVVADCNVFVFDWGRRDDVSLENWQFDTDIAARRVLLALRNAVRSERLKLAAGFGPARRFIGVNAVCNDAERIFQEFIGAARTPIATRIRQGYVNELVRVQDLISGLNAGDAGRKVSGEVQSRPGIPGFVFYLTHLLLDSGSYRFSLEFDFASDAESSWGNSGLGLEVLANRCLISDRAVTMSEALGKQVEIEFFVPPSSAGSEEWPETGIRMRTTGSAAVTIRRAMLEQLTTGEAPETATDFDFLPLLTVGAAGTREPVALPVQGVPEASRTLSISSKPGVPDYLVYGPHVWLLPGRYEARFEFWAPVTTEQRDIEAHIEVVSALGQTILVEQAVEFSEPNGTYDNAWRRARGSLLFDVYTIAPPESEGLLEVRVWTRGAALSLTELRVHRIDDASPIDRPTQRLFDGKLDRMREPIARLVRKAYLDHGQPPKMFHLLHVGPAGRRIATAVEALPGQVGILTHGPYVWLLPGSYEVTFEFNVNAAVAGSYIRVEVAVETGRRLLATNFVEPRKKGVVRSTLRFAITTDIPPPEEGLLEFRVWSPGDVGFQLTAIHLREVESSESDVADEPRIEPLSNGLNVLGSMEVGRSGRRGSSGISAQREPGFVAYGPYVPLEPGRYVVEFEVFAVRTAPKRVFKFEVATSRGAHILAEQLVQPHWHGEHFERFFGKRRGQLTFELPFEVGQPMSGENTLVEFRAWSPGMMAVTLKAVRVRRFYPAQAVAEETAPSSP
jgi:hypothetical protein